MTGRGGSVNDARRKRDCRRWRLHASEWLCIGRVQRRSSGERLTVLSGIRSGERNGSVRCRSGYSSCRLFASGRVGFELAELQLAHFLGAFGLSMDLSEAGGREGFQLGSPRGSIGCGFESDQFIEYLVECLSSSGGRSRLMADLLDLAVRVAALPGIAATGVVLAGVDAIQDEFGTFKVTGLGALMSVFDEPIVLGIACRKLRWLLGEGTIKAGAATQRTAGKHAPGTAIEQQPHIGILALLRCDKPAARTSAEGLWGESLWDEHHEMARELGNPRSKGPGR